MNRLIISYEILSKDYMYGSNTRGSGWGGMSVFHYSLNILPIIHLFKKILLINSLKSFPLFSNNLDIFNPIMIEGYAALFSCTAVVQASDSMTASM